MSVCPLEALRRGRSSSRFTIAASFKSEETADVKGDRHIMRTRHYVQRHTVSKRDDTAAPFASTVSFTREATEE